MSDLLTRVRDAPQRRLDLALDVALATMLSIIGLVQLGDHPGLLPVLAGLSITMTVVLRGFAPRVACLTALAAGLVYAHTAANPSQSAVGPIVLVLDFYALGSRAGARRGTAADAVVLLLAVPVVAATPGDGHLVDVVTVAMFFFLMPYAVGRVVGTRRALNHELRANAERLADERRDRVRQVIADERTRIARELHDVVAHNVSVMVIQTVAARRVLGHDAAAARTAMGAVERCGREALGELRRMVGVVRQGDLDTVATQPGLGQLASLVERARAAGLEVETRIDGTPAGVPPELDLVAFRVVQEALTNAIKHAGPAVVDIHVRFTAQALELTVSDDGPGLPRAQSDRGSGLIGMGERLAMYGGRLEAGPDRRGGFRVRAWLPLAAEVA